MRRALFGLFSFVVLCLACTGGMIEAGARAVTIDSGALGLPKSKIEAVFGPSGDPIEMPGHPIFDETYAYETEEGTLTVSYRDVDGVPTAVFIEFAWVGDGVGDAVASDLVDRCLPADATLTELYTAPPTPNGPIALVMNRYESDSLGRIAALAPEILVIFHERWDVPGVPDGRSILSVTITVRERTQLTG
ncbi:MAG: hypothetical protein IT336_07805 [Thermomicrobiales bacterium]|nr:hypothetical protein [Thermomicrobiales bacterium]